ncbi:MAG: hypothetical protein K8R54_06235 [Bacteroidales bacterium]|nr:hypothetical protein [Bacteroidales bacterium]
MKLSNLLLPVILFIAFTLVFQSCKKDNNEKDLVQTSEDYADVQELFNDLSLQANLYENGDKTGCPVVTITFPDSPPFPRHIVIDFGDEGCEGPHGRIRTGKIIVDQTDFYFNEGAVRTFTLDDFYVNDFHVEGIREVTCNGRNADSLIQHSIVVTEGKVTFPDGRVITREASRTRVWFEGEDTPWNFYDDKYRITGTASGINRFGDNYESEITEPIIFDMSCIYRLVQGVVTITTEGYTITIDYGDGTCDNIAIVTIDGEESTIHFRRR